MEGTLSSSSGQHELEDLVGEEDWSSTNTLTLQDRDALFALLECSICVTFLQDAVECPGCHKLFCQGVFASPPFFFCLVFVVRKCNDDNNNTGCISGWLRSAKTCPCCRAPADLKNFSRNVVIQRFLDGMSVECPHAGCPTRPARSDLENHVQVCSFRPQVAAQKKEERRRELQAKLARVEASYKQGNVTADEILLLCQDLISIGDQSAALQWAERARSMFPKLPACEVAVAECLVAAGQWQRALALFQKNNMHRQTAQCELKLGHYDEAEKALLAVLKEGNDALTLCSLGALKKKTAAYSDAKRYLEDALRLVTPGGAGWIEATMSLADCLRKTEQYEESKRLYVQVLKRAEIVHGKKSAEVSAALNALGMLSKKLGDYPAAIKYYKAAIKLKVSLNNNDFNHAEVGEFLANLGDVYRKESNYNQAEALYMRALKIFEATVGTKHIECADVLNSLGLVKKKFALYDEAADLYDRALSICRATFKDKPHYKTGIYLNNRADVERKRGNYDQALAMYDESLSLLRATVGATHSECADPLHAKGLVLHQLGKYQEAIASIVQAQKIVEREFGVNHYKYGVFLSSSGLAKAMMNDIDGAYADLKQSLQTLIRTLGPSHVEVADVYSALADVCLKLFVEGGRDQGKLEEAKKYVELSREICINKFGANHTKVQQCESLLFIVENAATLM